MVGETGPGRARHVLNMALTVAAAVLAGWACASTGLPLGWLVGPMLVMIAASLAGLPATQPTMVLPYIRGSVGTLLGASVTPALFHSFTLWWPSLLVMCAVMAVGGLVNYRLLNRGFGFPRLDAALCAMPGGIAEMVLLGERAGADQRRIAIVHALRIALSILLIPLIAGWFFEIAGPRPASLAAAPMSPEDWGWFAACIAVGLAAQRWIPMPAPLILAPLVASAALHLSGVSAFHVPGAVSRTVQVVIGMNVGARFIGISPAALARVALSAVAVVAVQIALAVSAALAAGALGAWDPLALMLAYAPGGLAEMSIIALAMGREVAFVTFHHILRVLTALFIAPPTLSRLEGG